MDWLLALAARGLVRLLQALPLSAVARLGRAFGQLAFLVDGRHRRVAQENLTRCFGTELAGSEIRAIARENFRRIGENFACAVKTATLRWEALQQVLEVRHLERLHAASPPEGSPNRVVAIGHFGNFELFACVSALVPGYQFATTYRALRPPALDRVLQSIRERSGCLFFERRFEAEALKDRMRQGHLVLGLLSDQHGGTRGVWGSFLGQECSTTPAPAVFALRYDCPLVTAICYRVALGRWRIEVGEPIPTRTAAGQARPISAIVRDMNLAFEAAIRRDPANWFWVHRRWKPRGRTHPPTSPAGPPPETGQVFP